MAGSIKYFIKNV